MASFRPTVSFSFKAESAVSKNTIVKLGVEDGACEPALAGEGFGVAMCDADLGSFVEVAMIGGGAKVLTGAAVSKGDEIAADADGKAVPAIAGDIVIGLALDGAPNADIAISIERTFYVKA
jgi:hypothetical protein